MDFMHRYPIRGWYAIIILGGNIMPRAIKKSRWLAIVLGSLLLLAILIAACGGATTGGGSVPQNAPARSAQGGAAGAGGQSSGSQNKQSYSVPQAPTGPQYLIKALRVDMQVKDTMQVATDLQSWVSTTDPRSSTGGIDYQQVGDNLYNVSITFTVQATLYPQVEHYFASYAPLHKGKLLDLHETVQDVTNDYVDTQSRLKNLRGEQERLLTLLKNAQALGDILSIEQRLTDVEGQIEEIEAHLNALNGQVTFYNVVVNLQPIDIPASPPPQNTPWNPGGVLHDALSAALGFGQGLATLFIWLAVFSVYLIPAVLIFLVVRRLRIHGRPILRAPVAPVAPVASATSVSSASSSQTDS